MSNYLSVCGQCVTQKVIEKSRFITTSAHVEGEDEARAFVARVSAEFADATHNCYAYICDSTGNFLRFSDDGEPQGTAGMPMLEVLKAKKLVQTAVVVTRYFGGIKLGAGGLVSAYTDSVATGIDAAGTVSMTERSLVEVRAGYQEFSRADSALIRLGAERMSADYGEDVRAIYAVKADAEARALACASEATSGAARTTVTGRIFLPERED